MPFINGNSSHGVKRSVEVFVDDRDIRISMEVGPKKTKYDVRLPLADLLRVIAAEVKPGASVQVPINSALDFIAKNLAPPNR